MNVLRASSIIGSGSGVSIIRFSSLRLICLSLGASFLSYATSPIGLARNTFPVHGDVDEPVEPAQAVVHVSVPVSQLFLEKDLERFGELFGDVRKAMSFIPRDSDELPEVKLRGLRLAVGGGGIDLLGADPEPFAFHLSGLQEVFRHGIGTGYGGLEQPGRDHSLVPQQVPLRLFQPASEGGGRLFSLAVLISHFCCPSPGFSNRCLS